jgi:hypothetical protein
MLSDGIWAAMAILHPSVQAKIGRPIKKNDILGVRKCTTKFVVKENQQHPIIIFLDPPTIIYSDIDTRIGQPKEFTLDLNCDSSNS